ncbi:DUF6387 family protein, partial [Klebsiella pneumoniae]|uniref:DUF6387 family protein n=1 Tax=Klebsiella pneumoniae TaxID=573 RepID=UPI0020CDC861
GRRGRGLSVLPALNGLRYVEFTFFFEENGDFKKELKKKPITKTMRDFFLNQNSSKMYVSFDLGLSSDEEIITTLQTMLPDLRKEYEIEPVKTEKIGLAKIRKLVDYNIIP